MGRKSQLVEEDLKVDEETKFKYEQAWLALRVAPEQFYHVGNHVFACLDVHSDSIAKLQSHVFQRFHKNLTMAYTDPPWNAANLSSFIHKAKALTNANFDEFLHTLIRGMKDAVAGDIYVEMGTQHVLRLQQVISHFGGSVLNTVPITYYKTRPTNLVRCSWHAPAAKEANVTLMTGCDDEETPYLAVVNSSERGAYVLDPCVGLGATARAAVRSERFIAGADLNPKRLAYTITQTSEALHIKPMLVTP